MKTTLLRTLLAAGLLALGALPVTAATAPNEATVLQLTGTAQVVRTPGAAPVALRVGDKIPQGATIITGAASTLHIQPFSGAVSTVNASTEVTLEKLTLDTNASGRVTKQTALLNLKSGNVVSLLDPDKKDINDYGVSTPKGVAAARGTQFTSLVNGQEVTVSANADGVVFSNASGTYTVANGNVSFVAAGSTTAQVMPLTALANANSPLANAARAAVAAGVTALTQVLQTNANTGVSASATTNLAAQVIAVSNVADPAGAATKTAAVVSAISNNSAVTAGGKAGSVTAVAAVMQYATDAVRETTAGGQTTNPTVVNAVGDFAAAVSTNLATSSGGTLNAAELVNASTQGAVRATPVLAGDIAAKVAAANTTNSTVVAAAIQGAITAAPDQQSAITTKSSAAAPSQAGAIAKASLSVVAPSNIITDGATITERILAEAGLLGSKLDRDTVLLQAGVVTVPPPLTPAATVPNAPTTGGTTTTPEGFPVQQVPQPNTTITP